MTTPSRPALVLLLVLCAGFPALADAPVEDKDRPLRPGDPITVSIRDLEGPAKTTLVEASVDEDGQLTLPMLRKPVTAKGLTPEKLRDAIAQAYRQANLVQNARVTVKLRPGKEDEARPLRVGDALAVTIRDLEGPGKNTIIKADVDRNGQVTLPMLSKPVPATGLTKEKLCDAIVKAYERDNLIANAIVTVKFRSAENKQSPAPKE